MWAPAALPVALRAGAWIETAELPFVALPPPDDVVRRL
jgi:hypothetical protein